MGYNHGSMILNYANIQKNQTTEIASKGVFYESC